jgi:hypothetical protein
MLKYRGYCEAHINKFYVLLAVNNFLTHPAVTGGFSSLACSHINFGRVIFPCFKWAPLNHSSPLATDSAWQSALARAALLFSYKLFCCQAGSIQLCYASLPPLHLCSTWEFFYTLYTQRTYSPLGLMYYVRIYMYIYKTQHQSLYSWGDGIKK